MNKVILLFFSVLLLFSCNSDQDNSVNSDIVSRVNPLTVENFLDSLDYPIDSSDIPDEYIIVQQMNTPPRIGFRKMEDGALDERGWKHGTHHGSSGIFQFTRTYRNDTLNGPFTKGLGHGPLSKIGFYKKGDRDGLWISYYPDGHIESIESYKEGLRQGRIKHFYQGSRNLEKKVNGQYHNSYTGGKIKYEATFHADTMVGEAIRYFENGEIEAKGNSRNGKWMEYHENGQLASVEHYLAGRLDGKSKKYDEAGKPLIPVYLEQSAADSCVTNNTDLNVHLLFEQAEKEQRIFVFGEKLFQGPRIVSTDESVVLEYGYEHIILKEKGVQLEISSHLTKGREIKATHFGTNFRIYESGDHITDSEKSVSRRTSLGTLIVHQKKEKCQDTGSNPITIIRPEGKLEIEHIGNLQYFEYDLDGNGSQELYLMSYESCQGYLKIYKIEE